MNEVLHAVSKLIAAQDEEEGPTDILDDNLQQQLNEMADYNSDEEDNMQPSSSQANEGMGAAASAQSL